MKGLSHRRAGYDKCVDTTDEPIHIAQALSEVVDDLTHRREIAHEQLTEPIEPRRARAA